MTSKIILINSEDWEKWFWELQASVNEDIWPYIDPEGDDEPLLQKLIYPLFADFKQNATIFAMLSAAHQKAYKAVRWFFNQDIRLYNHQHDQLKKARTYITTSVSQLKKIFLNPKLSVCQWLQNLKADTASPKRYIIMQIKNQYQDVLRSFKGNKLSSWLNKWKDMMIEDIKYNILKLQNNH